MFASGALKAGRMGRLDCVGTFIFATEADRHGALRVRDLGSLRVIPNVPFRIHVDRITIMHFI